MKFSHSILQEYIDKKLPIPAKLAELLTLHAFEVGSVKKVGQDYVYDIDILPNRAHDAAGHIGVARDIASIIGGRLKLNGKAFKKGKVPGLSIEINNKNLCLRYTAAVLLNVKVKDSPAWLKTRMLALGVKPINNIVDAVNYSMIICGQPLHAFDYDKIAQHRIIIRSAKNGESMEALDNNSYLLENDMLVIADGAGPVAIAGIKGGRRAEVTAQTRAVVLEAANFDALSIRQTSRKLGLATDASWRFEHELSPALTEQALAMVVALIEKIAAGRRVGGFVDFLAKPIPKHIIAIRTQYTRDLLGVDITQKKIARILNSLAFETKVKGADMLIVTIPSFRLDVEREEDLIEEIGRIIGYEKITPQVPHAALRAPSYSASNYWRRAMRDGLAARGFNEIYSPAFISERLSNAWNFKPGNLWELENPLSEKLHFLTPSLLPNLTRTACDNLRFFDTVRIFEVAKTFKRSTVAYEEERLAVLIAVRDNDPQYFFELKGIIIQLLNSLGVTGEWFDDALQNIEAQTLQYMHPTRIAQIKVGDAVLGVIGQLHPRIVSTYGCGGAVFLCEMSFAKIVDEAEGEQEYDKVSDYPKAVRDISIVVSRSTRIGHVIGVIDEAGVSLLRDVDLFDYYEDHDSSKDEKSIAFHLIFQADDRTLTSKEVDNLMDKIIQALQKQQGWKVK